MKLEFERKHRSVLWRARAGWLARAREECARIDYHFRLKGKSVGVSGYKGLTASEKEDFFKACQKLTGLDAGD